MALCIWKKYNVTQYTEWLAQYANNANDTFSEGFTVYSSYSVDHNSFYGIGPPYALDVGKTGYVIGQNTLHYYYNVRLNEGSVGNYYKFKHNQTVYLRASRPSYTQGAYLTTVTAEANTYPQNGRHTDGYWYVYQGLANKAPTISGTDTNFGTLTELEYKYSINDTDPSDTITVIERLDGTQLRTFTATRDIEYTIKPIWVEILNGIHTLTITATDNIGASTVRTITFAKAEHELEFTLQTPLPADDMVTKTIMSITREIPAGAVMQIYVCNNGFDEIPTWEDITAKVVDGEKFFFANTVKTAAEWGYNIKICVQRLGADVGDAIFITSVGGNFE